MQNHKNNNKIIYLNDDSPTMGGSCGQSTEGMDNFGLSHAPPVHSVQAGGAPKKKPDPEAISDRSENSENSDYSDDDTVTEDAVAVDNMPKTIETGAVNEHVQEEYSSDEDSIAPIRELHSDDESLSSLNTNDILKVDPVYYRLTKFLQTDSENVAEVLASMRDEIKNLNNSIIRVLDVMQMKK
jgi:hypothetical protein